MLPSSKLLHDESSGPPESDASRDQGSAGMNGASIAPVNAERNDDDPPPYTAIAPPNHVGWPFDFSGIPYSAASCRSGSPLRPFQPLAPTSGPTFDPEGPDGQHTSISMPLMPCRLFKFGSHRSIFAQTLPFSDNISVSKDSQRRTRKYGAILAAAAVIIFLMVLSLLVRFVMEKSLWRR
ncbi:uncharacterized protein LOC116425020 [Nomia melanderi]|uniref:uncharacterized protein LOC116425020 n=1 Tax=Nomia melanderi TaxID=2448451 RepID=UPI001304657D|nr:uncharacterized protein LOC116425020 [Nomia melanderi]XP_031828038.1 uncharacterized protein LOC116425020 [Nomia melanderi]XP_031828039.1 uncharacterized protein LOC116425020 [Nomia melanderi]XP_031828040.1 uncharacterized protein LOC116425020 [Nomia melanderi]XP_031828041.1 uncharacterized protein LOC116425020 [Nomia melanderi]XP_031828042.1 uncharacterized protein LOC116425020 [Nomia melanderi]XP_031828043.1 uncharacterized protein LOC116425020 [Nomia melanderi]